MEKKETNYVVRKVYYIAAPDPDDVILRARDKSPDLVKCVEYRRKDYQRDSGEIVQS